MGFVTPGDQDLPAPVSIEIGREYGLLDAETGIDHELFETFVRGTGSAAGKNEKTEGENMHGGQYNSRLSIECVYENLYMMASFTGLI